MSDIPPAPNTPKFSIAPEKRGMSYIGAAGIIALAVSSAMAIENPMYRTGAILVCAVVAYLLGLRTQ